MPMWQEQGPVAPAPAPEVTAAQVAAAAVAENDRRKEGERSVAEVESKLVWWRANVHISDLAPGDEVEWPDDEGTRANEAAGLISRVDVKDEKAGGEG